MGTLRQEVKRLAAELKAMTAERDALVGILSVAVNAADAWLSHEEPESNLDEWLVSARAAIASPTTALDHIRAQAKAEGLREAWPHVRMVICSHDLTDCEGHVFCDAIRSAILAAAEKEPRHD